MIPLQPWDLRPLFKEFAVRIFASFMLALCLTTVAVANERPVMIVGSGEVSGYYYPAAGALCRVINKDHPKGLTCAVSPSSGSASNIAQLRSGGVDYAIIQSRALHLASVGADPFKEGGPFQDLRAVLSLNGEQVVLLARSGSGIESMADLKGKRVNLGRAGSFQRNMAEWALDASGISEGDLAPALEMDLAEQVQALCEGTIDAGFFSGVHPMNEVLTAQDECNPQFIPLRGKTSEAFFKKNPWLSKSVIRKGTYDEPKDDIPTLAVRAVLATTSKVPADQVYDVLKAVHANFSPLSRLHPALKGLNKAESAKDGMAIRLHDGAEKFYAETGLK